jgi:cytochrome P450
MQKRNKEALELINKTLTQLIAESKAVLDAENLTFDEEDFLSKADPSILHFLIASGDDITSKQLRDDLMTLLIAGHETTAAVLTWTTHLLVQHPDIQAQAQREVCLSVTCFHRPDALCLGFFNLQNFRRIIHTCLQFCPICSQSYLTCIESMECTHTLNGRVP